MQWTRTASLCSPLTPTVRHGCAARSLPLTAPRFHETSSGAGKPQHAASTPTPHDEASSHPARSSSSPIRLRSHGFPEHNGAHPVPLTARPPWLAAPPRHHRRGIRFSSSYRVPSPRAQPLRSCNTEKRREPRNAQLQSIGAIRLVSTRSVHLRSRPGLSGVVQQLGHLQPASSPFGRA